MKLVFIYGPPGVGKLTVAKELSKITNFKVFHNHMTNDFVVNFETFGTKRFWKYVGKIKEVIYHMAFENNTNLITTGCYAKGHDDKSIKRKIKLFKKNKSQIYFVRLYCDKPQLENRVIAESRKEHGKLRDLKELKKVLKKYDFLAPIPFVKSLEINNSNISAKNVAKMIKKHYKL